MGVGAGDVGAASLAGSLAAICATMDGGRRDACPLSSSSSQPGAAAGSCADFRLAAAGATLAYCEGAGWRLTKILAPVIAATPANPMAMILKSAPPNSDEFLGFPHLKNVKRRGGI